MRWGLYGADGEPGQDLHVAPCDEEGWLLSSHILDQRCPCRPALVDETKRRLFVHEMIQ